MSTNFDELLDDVLEEKLAEPPVGLQQRLMARLEMEAERSRVFTFAERVETQRSPASFWTAIGLHAAVFALIAVVVASKVQVLQPKVSMETELTVPPPPPIALRVDKMGGGGGQHDLSPATQGRLPKPATEQLLPPMAPPTIEPKLAVEPTVVLQKDLKMADNTMPNLGVPNSSLRGVSLGDGSGTGIGSGDGGGLGPGSGGGTGGGVMHIGGAVSKPEVLYSVEPEFSEEARKAKFSGNVQVYLWVDEKGNPSHVRVIHGVGMGLDEKAVEAVRQYKFKPARLNGKPVKVDLYMMVDFTIF